MSATSHQFLRLVFTVKLANMRCGATRHTWRLFGTPRESKEGPFEYDRS